MPIRTRRAMRRRNESWAGYHSDSSSCDSECGLSSDSAATSRRVGRQITLADLAAEEAARHEPSAAEAADRAQLRTLIQDAVEQVWEGRTAHLYGSFAFGLGCRDAPIDLAVEGCDRQRVRELVSAVGHRRLRLLRLIDWDEADVSLLRIEDTATGLRANVTVFAADSVGLGPASAAALRRLLDAHPAAATVARVVRELLRRRGGLHTASAGALSSHAVALMVLHCCARHSAAVSEDAGLLLVEFLHLFGGSFDGRVQCVSTDAAATDLSPQERSQLPAGGLYVADPAQPGINAAQSCTRWPEVQSALRAALAAAVEAVQADACAAELLAAVLGYGGAAATEVSTPPLRPSPPPALRPQQQPPPPSRRRGVTFADDAPQDCKRPGLLQPILSAAAAWLRPC